MITKRDIPHLPIVVAACAAAVGGYAVFSIYAVVWMKDPSLTGDIIGTWKSFAVLAFGFWIGSSSGGKANAEVPKGTQEDPVKTEIVNELDAPANVRESKGPKP